MPLRGYEYGRLIGTLSHVYPPEWKQVSPQANMRNQNTYKGSINETLADLTYIEVTDPKILDRNIYSSDAITTPQLGDELCTYGRRTKTIHCAPIFYQQDALIYTEHMGTDHSDSGGPA
ncbi:hypothetical protein ACQX3Y_09985 [Corynebacterium diphtheriae]|nr:hypothetical protein FRC0076_02025 [Corynebacterium diphtheriae]CAB0711645.1 hypothetical protein FRC0077_02033 [Corynebacterium diphtheriae]